MPRRSRPAVGVVVVVVAVVIGLAVSCRGFREDEIECEKAIVHLGACCLGFRAERLDCSYNERLGCADEVKASEYPVLSLNDSRCLRQKSCEDLAVDGDCSRAQNAQRRVDSHDKSIASNQPGPVCAR